MWQKRYYMQLQVISRSRYPGGNNATQRIEARKGMTGQGFGLTIKQLFFGLVQLDNFGISLMLSVTYINIILFGRVGTRADIGILNRIPIFFMRMFYLSITVLCAPFESIPPLNHFIHTLSHLLNFMY